MFRPHRCPYRGCSQHVAPRLPFFRRFGSYWPRCRPKPVQRYQCRACNRTFSRQTFRADYRDHKPHLNAALFSMLASGVGLRQSARNLGLSRKCTELKFRKLGRHLRRLNLNLQGQFSTEVSLHFDELETYEGQRNTRPLSVPVLIESKTRFIVWAEAAPIRPRGSMTNKRLKAIAQARERYGVRKDLSRRSVRRTLERGSALSMSSESVTLQTDEKSSYPRLAERAWKKTQLHHVTTNSKLVRMTWNPLFPINNEEAIMRDLMGRLRRDSWLVSKKRRYLDLGLHVHMAYRNLVRKRFNYDEESPAQLLGFAHRRMRPEELMSWRQDWGAESIHPLSRTGTSVRSWKARLARAA